MRLMIEFAIRELDIAQDHMLQLALAVPRHS